LYLNPYYEYIDTYNVSVGNPKLTAIHWCVWISWIKNKKHHFHYMLIFSRWNVPDHQLRQDTKITTLFYDNIGKSKDDYLSTPVIPQKKMVEVQLILK
jgi:hypothetical protein